eukprot:811124-Prorocentrum_minimum.AAC.1
MKTLFTAAAAAREAEVEARHAAELEAARRQLADAARQLAEGRGREEEYEAALFEAAMPRGMELESLAEQAFKCGPPVVSHCY